MLYESNYYGVCDLGDSLEHHGILGQKWGVRRYQNKDGTLTAAGKRRYKQIDDQYNKDLNEKLDPISRKIDDRISELLKNDKKLQRESKNWTSGDGTEYVDAIYEYTKDKKMKDLMDDFYNTFKSLDDTRNQQLKDLHDHDSKMAEERAQKIQNVKDSVKSGIETAKTKAAEFKQAQEERKAANIEKKKEKAIEKGDAKTLLKYSDTMTTNDINDALNRMAAEKRLKDLAYPDRKSTLEKITDAAGTLSSMGNKVVSLKNTYDNLKKAFSSDDDDRSEGRKLYDEHLSKSVKNAMEEARKNTSGSTADKEYAAYKVARDTAKASEEFEKRERAEEKAKQKAEAESKRAEKNAKKNERAAAKARLKGEEAVERIKIQGEKKAEEEERKRKKKGERLRREQYLTSSRGMGWSDTSAYESEYYGASILGDP